jgi:hypothetical protein
MRKKRNRISDETLSAATCEAVRHLGWFIPTDEDAVAEAEARLTEGTAGLPPALRNVADILDGADQRPLSGRMIQPWSSERMDATLSRAAREGGSVSPEIEKLMKRDRDRAEAEYSDALEEHGDND